MTLSREATPARGAEQAPPDLMHAMLQEMLQAAVQAEFDHFLGAGRWPRSEERRGWRSGHTRRRLHPRVGTIELRIPKDWEGRFQPSLFERYPRSEKARVLTLIEERRRASRSGRAPEHPSPGREKLQTKLHLTRS